MAALVNARCNDALLGESGPYVVCGPAALNRVGLSSFLTEEVIAWTDVVGINGIHTGVSCFYFNPCIDYVHDVKPSIAHRKILEPTRERALAEYIWLREYFDEGILIEGLKNYIWLSDDDLSKLYSVAPRYHCTHEMLDYWIEEARNDYDD